VKPMTNLKHLNSFFRFMCERQAIWHKRFVLHQPPPWTQDRIFRKFKFTNVYRELDAGTIWYLSCVYPESKKFPVSDRFKQINLLWLTLIYRLVNRVETFEKVGFVPFWLWKRDGKAWIGKLETLSKTNSITTAAHRTLPASSKELIGLGRVGILHKVLDDASKKLTVQYFQLKNSPSLEDAFNTIRDSFLCVGPFIAYEIVCDLMLTRFLPFTENDWVNPGPGCKSGLKLIFPDTKGTLAFQERIKQLQQSQKKHFKRLGLKFQPLYPRRPLTLRSIEHSLCEYSKYSRAKAGTGRPKVTFKPRDWPDSEGHLPFRFPRD